VTPQTFHPKNETKLPRLHEAHTKEVGKDNKPMTGKGLIKIRRTYGTGKRNTRKEEKVSKAKYGTLFLGTSLGSLGEERGF